MNCANCHKPTNIATGYALPIIVRSTNTVPQQLYACSKECRDEWNTARRQVLEIQKEVKTSASNQTN
jgi:hypothetical protein